ncbi:hypothetical protein BKA80DRAFT_121823 [Phyllosticta citrichinensis]
MPFHGTRSRSWVADAAWSTIRPMCPGADRPSSTPSQHLNISTSQHHPNPSCIASTMVDRSENQPQILAFGLLAPTRPPIIHGRPVCHPSSSSTTLTFLYQYRVARLRPFFLCFLQPVTVDGASHRLVASSPPRRIVSSRLVSSILAASASPSPFRQQSSLADRLLRGFARRFSHRLRRFG